VLEVFRRLGAEGPLSALDVEPEQRATTDWLGICLPHGAAVARKLWTRAV
jgi:hypothetical protein